MCVCSSRVCMFCTSCGTFTGVRLPRLARVVGRTLLWVSLMCSRVCAIVCVCLCLSVVRLHGSFVSRLPWVVSVLFCFPLFLVLSCRDSFHVSGAGLVVACVATWKCVSCLCVLLTPGVSLLQQRCVYSSRVIYFVGFCHIVRCSYCFVSSTFLNQDLSLMMCLEASTRGRTTIVAIKLPV